MTITLAEREKYCTICKNIVQNFELRERHYSKGWYIISLLRKTSSSNDQLACFVGSYLQVDLKIFLTFFQNFFNAEKKNRPIDQ